MIEIINEPQSTAIIRYTPHKTPMEVLQSVVEKGIATGSISIHIITPPPSTTTVTFSKIPETPKNPLSTRKIELQAPSCGGTGISLEDSEKKLKKLVDDFNRMAREEFPGFTYSSSYSSIAYKPSPIDPPKMLNGDEIAEALQSEAAFTIASDKKPIVATYGCGPCVAVGGYDSTNNMAFIVHFAAAREVKQASELLLYNISKLAKKKIERPIQIHLRGCIKGKSEGTIEAIKMWMGYCEDLPMVITTEDILDYGMDSKSLSIDSRTGAVGDYSPLANPHHRIIGLEDHVFAISSSIKPNIRVAYTPKS
jgi:hypothetical protein